MIHINIILLFFLSLIANRACHAQADQFEWLIGTWKLDSKNVYEIWTRDNKDGPLSAQSYTVRGADTTVTESIALKFVDGAYHYIPDVAGDQPPVDFAITSFGEGHFVAENEHHDFPKIIRYHRREKNRLEATIEGDGKVVRYSFQRLR